MIVREAYRETTHRLCRSHYAHPPEDMAPLGLVTDGRGVLGCEVCEEPEEPDTMGPAFGSIDTRR